MPVINTGLLTKGLRSEFFNRFNDMPTHYQDLTTHIRSNADRETYRWLGNLPGMREWGTGRVARGLGTESYSVENLKYESTLEVDRDEIADDKTGQIRLRISALAQRAASHKDYLISRLLANGEGTGFTSYDGMPFFSDDHESGSSGTQGNRIDSPAAEPEHATTEEFKRAMKAAIATLTGFRDDQGEPMAISPTGLIAVVPTSLYLTALEAVNASTIDSTTNVLNGFARVIPFPWLNVNTRWYLLKNDGVIRPFIFQDREPVEFTALIDDSDEGFRREKYLYGVRARYRLVYGYWQYAVRINFVTP